MSLASWKLEFLPTSAESVAGGTVREVLLHSLEKWKGLTTENLAKHLLVKKVASSRIEETETPNWEWMVDDTCSLCAAAKAVTYPLAGPEMSGRELRLRGFGDQHCKNCLLAHYGERKGCIPEYTIFARECDQQPMISLLGGALAEATEAGHLDIPAKDAV